MHRRTMLHLCALHNSNISIRIKIRINTSAAARIDFNLFDGNIDGYFLLYTFFYWCENYLRKYLSRLQNRWIRHGWAPAGGRAGMGRIDFHFSFARLTQSIQVLDSNSNSKAFYERNAARHVKRLGLRRRGACELWTLLLLLLYAFAVFCLNVSIY